MNTDQEVEQLATTLLQQSSENLPDFQLATAARLASDGFSAVAQIIDLLKKYGYNERTSAALICRYILYRDHVDLQRTNLSLEDYSALKKWFGDCVIICSELRTHVDRLAQDAYHKLAPGLFAVICDFVAKKVAPVA